MTRWALTIFCGACDGEAWSWWKQPQRASNQIDYIAISSRFRSRLLKVDKKEVKISASKRSAIQWWLIFACMPLVWLFTVNRSSAQQIQYKPSSRSGYCPAMGTLSCSANDTYFKELDWQYWLTLGPHQKFLCLCRWSCETHPKRTWRKLADRGNVKDRWTQEEFSGSELGEGNKPEEKVWETQRSVYLKKRKFHHYAGKGSRNCRK